MPTPAEAAAILKAAMDTGFDPVKLALLRKGQGDELQRNRDLEQSSSQDAMRSRLESRFKSPSERNRDEMMGWDTGGTSMRSGATASDVQNLQDDIHNDPFTGDAEQARVGGIQKALDAANTTNRQEVGDAAKTVANRNAFAEFMKTSGGKRGEFAAETSPEGTAALEAQSRRKMAEDAAKFGMSQGAKPLSADGEKTVQGLHEAQAIGTRLHQLLTDAIKANPQDQATADEAPGGSELGAIASQLPSVATARLKKFFYDQGVVQPPGKYDELTRLADQMKVYATKGLLGNMRNMKFVDQIQNHLTNGKLPNAANLERLNGFLQTAPDIEQAVYDTERGKAGNLRLNRPSDATRGALPPGVTVKQVP